MKVTYNKMAEKIIVDGKPVKKGTQKWEKAVVEYICTELSRGKGLQEILPEYQGALPNILEFWEIEKNPKFKAQLNKAKDNRVAWLTENLIKSANVFIKSKDKVDYENMEAIKKTIDLLHKVHVDREVVLQINRAYPDGFWDD